MSEFDPLPDPLSDEPPTDHERELLADAFGIRGGVTASRPVADELRDLLRVLRAGHAAGRRSVLDASPRVFRVGDPEPEVGTALLDGDGDVEQWDPAIHHDWLDYLRCYGPLVQVNADVDYDAAVTADERRRAES